MKFHLLAALLSCVLAAPAWAQPPEVPRNVSLAATATDKTAQRWEQLVGYVNSLPESHRAGHVNLVLNGLRYASDMETTG